MRALRYVSPGEDDSHVVVETVAGDEQFVLRINNDLRAVLQSDLPRLRTSTPVVVQEPPVGPRQIQIRVRAGESAESIADESGMALDRVLRFAAPVLEERSRVADEARRARARRPEGQQVVFGEAVDARFAAHGIDPGTVLWDACRLEDGTWSVTATWIGGEGEHSARWCFNLSARTVSPVDDAAGDLLSDRPVRPVAPVSVPTLTSLPTRTPDDIAYAAPAEPAAETRITAPLPHAHPSQQLFDQHDQPSYEYEALPLRLASADGTPVHARPRPPTRREESEEDKAARARIPSWDDILLGVRRKSD